MSNNIVLFGENQPDVYRLIQIYDPDIHGLDPAASGKVIPAVGSIVVDNPQGVPQYTLWVVHSVDPVTFKSTLVPARIIYEDGNEAGRLVSYGNDVHMLYFDDRCQPKRLVVDSKLVIIGANSVEYKLVRLLPDGSRLPISVSIDADGSSIAEFTAANVGDSETLEEQRVFDVTKTIQISTFVAMVWVNGVVLHEGQYEAILKPGDPTKVQVTIAGEVVYDIGATVVIRLYSVSDRAPIIPTAIEGIRKCSVSYTNEPMIEGEQVALEIYDAAGVLTSRCNLIVKRATILNDYESSINPIVTFQAHANQEKTTGEFVLFNDQSPSQLHITPELVFADGTKHVTPIDGMSTFIYGLEDVNTTIPGMEYPILLKRFLSMNTPSMVGELYPDGTRFINLSKRIVIESKYRAGLSKISIIPIWNGSTWTFKLYAYYRDRNAYLDITSQITYSGTALNGSILDTRQNVVLQVPHTEMPGVETIFNQTLSIILRQPTNLVPYEFSNYEGSPTVYGIEDIDHKRPRLLYDADIQKYFVPNSLFTTKEWFLEQFFVHAEPPFLSESETQSPTPTHFVVRRVVDGRALTSVPVDINMYEGAFALFNDDTPNEHVDTTVIVEFLLKASGVYQILYGVPVEVKIGNYNP